MRRLPVPGLPARIEHLAHREAVVIEVVLDGGQTVVAGGRRFTLNRLTGAFVAEGEPYYGTRLVLEADPDD